MDTDWIDSISVSEDPETTHDGTDPSWCCLVILVVHSDTLGTDAQPPGDFLLVLGHTHTHTPHIHKDTHTPHIHKDTHTPHTDIHKAMNYLGI